MFTGQFTMITSWQAITTTTVGAILRLSRSCLHCAPSLEFGSVGYGKNMQRCDSLVGDTMF